jgi:hypothetical protein
VVARGSATASRHERGRLGDEEGETERRNRETGEVEWKLHASEPRHLSSLVGHDTYLA